MTVFMINSMFVLSSPVLPTVLQRNELVPEYSLVSQHLFYVGSGIKQRLHPIASTLLTKQTGNPG